MSQRLRSVTVLSVEAWPCAVTLDDQASSWASKRALQTLDLVELAADLNHLVFLEWRRKE